MSTNSRRAVFIDRDGTISEEVGYVNHLSRYRVFPFSATAIRLLNDAGWLAIVITNQAGVARGYFSEEMVAVVH
ncbi:MAG: D,D-heptose 1,7-bisphosphate phosphatase, partial [Pyrinomonadaceae bacterium]